MKNLCKLGEYKSDKIILLDDEKSSKIRLLNDKKKQFCKISLNNKEVIDYLNIGNHGNKKGDWLVYNENDKIVFIELKQKNIKDGDKQLLALVKKINPLLKKEKKIALLVTGAVHKASAKITKLKIELKKQYNCSFEQLRPAHAVYKL